MRKFTTLCIDKITGVTMILYECSYNAACVFLEQENKNNRFGEFKNTESVSLYVTKLIFENAVYIYDEERGVLMKEQKN